MQKIAGYLKSYPMLIPSILYCMFSINIILASVPRVSIITSVYKGDQFIEGFMKDITCQTIFDQCELIMINANSPGSEEEVIQKYIKKYPQIIYLKLDRDPGLYSVWNMAIKMAKAPYITNANLDDRLKFDCYEIHAKELDNFPDVDLVYSGCYKTTIANQTFADNDHKKVSPHSQQEFDKKKLINNLTCYPNNHPMWRKSIHQKYGLFNEHYKSAGDIEMWLRCAGLGKAKFKKINGVYGLYYLNPNGLSTAKNNVDEKEKKLIKRSYSTGTLESDCGIEFLITN